MIATIFILLVIVRKVLVSASVGKNLNLRGVMIVVLGTLVTQIADRVNVS